ncbi:hypothetical protein [Pseudanabaena sp. UWO310]|uniref:hypothetical protein n=1 Tax=Pseudanabaena sp. UWO310 TaxID=2480795 RepID=UPI001CC21FE0|nr:hypothetical protein [Pseudanabaena sp. UWO310]
MRFNEVPNIKPESVVRLRRATDSGKSGLVSYSLASPLATYQGNIDSCGIHYFCSVIAWQLPSNYRAINRQAKILLSKKVNINLIIR